MKIAIPTINGKLCQHFGHCQVFTIIDVNEEKNISSLSEETPPPHEPGVLPKWLAEKNVTAIIAGGMGQRAQDLFASHNIKVIVGATASEPKTVVENYLNGTLITGTNICDH